jgi:hypothetical protein
MTARDDLDRQLDAFLLDGPTELPRPSYLSLRDRTEQTSQRVLFGPWRLPNMNKIVSIGLGTAAVAVALVVGAGLFSTSAGIGGPPSPSPSPPTSSPSPALVPSGLPEGPFAIMPELTVTIPGPGWDGGDGVLSKGYGAGSADIGMIIFVQDEFIVYGDACHWKTSLPDKPATTVDEMVAALSSQGGREASRPVDITLDGHRGKSITLRVADGVDLTDCDPGYGGSWDCGGDGMQPCGYQAGADGVDKVYLLDVNGKVMAWETAYHTGTSPEDLAELEAIVQSASFND